MNFIHLVKNAYPLDSCNKLIEFFENNINHAKPGGAGKKVLNNLEITLEINDYDGHYNLGRTLLNSINEFKNQHPLVDKYICPWALNRYCQLMKYEPNNYYDVIHCENDGQPQNLNRVFAWMIYLNSISEGGGTEFVYQNFSTNPIAGDLYIWPAHWTHFHRGVNAPYETKYIITGWIDYVQQT